MSFSVEVVKLDSDGATFLVVTGKKEAWVNSDSLTSCRPLGVS